LLTKKHIFIFFIFLHPYLPISPVWTGCHCLSVLGLAGMELPFFVVAYIVLCFEFVTKTVLTTHLRFDCCWTVLAQPWGSLFSLLCSPSE